MKKAMTRSFEDSAIGGVNIVPVIDLCLVLLVILLIISPMLDTPPLPVELPQAETKEEKEDSIMISITPDGRMALDAEIIPPEQLPQLLQLLLLEQGQDALVVIRSDKNVTYGKLTELLKIVKNAGAQRISLGTEAPPEPVPTVAP
jgi:biopolymer transport protein TolR